jgi:uncharacterized protein CbrC (UPF0167 family)
VSVNLPEFPYHPDPLSTGSVKPSEQQCVCCGQARGFIYAGPVYAVEELDESLCPWCIADGSAAERFDADFTDLLDLPGDVPAAVVEEVVKRTPGFTGWQQEHWMFHCADAAAFLGPAGRAELESHADALDMLRHEHDAYGWSAEEVEDHVAALDRDGQPTAYLFRCLHCGTHLAYSDST